MPDSDNTCEQFVNPMQSVMSRFKLVSANKVRELLDNLSSSKATGLDQLPGQIVKAAGYANVPSLTHVFNHGILSSCFPLDWKMARFLPVC